MKTLTQTLLITLMLGLTAFQVHAADRYISDILVVTLRDEPNRTSNIIGHLRSGDYMTILEEHENGYIRVHIDSGLEGWVPKKYTSEGKSKDSIIRDLKKTIISLKDLNQKQQVKLEVMTAEVNDIQSNLDINATNEAKHQARILDLEKQVVEAQDKYITLKEQAEGVETVFTTNEILQKEKEQSTQELTALKKENLELDQTKNIFWFLSGATVLLMGYIIGRSGRKNRKNSLTM